MKRADVVDELARSICEISLDHPVRVAVDGVTASGKSTLATELEDAVAGHGRPAVRLSMDGFHHPRAHRYRRGRKSAEGYYLDAYDFGALVEDVLTPLGPGGDRRFRRRIIDLPSDTAVVDAPEVCPEEAVLVVDGTFLQRPPLDRHWDVAVFVDTDMSIARERGVERDHEALGGRDAAGAAFDQRYHEASRMYVEQVGPRERATFVFGNNVIESPTLRRQPPR